jgi:hypothetical protein
MGAMLRHGLAVGEGEAMANASSVETHDPQSPAEWRGHVKQYGYVIVHNALPPENLAATIDDI